MNRIFQQIREWFSPAQFSGKGGYRELFRIACPLLFLSASNVIMQFVDRKFLGNSSTEEMAASMPSASMINSLTIFFLVTANFSNALISQLYGAMRFRECVRVVWTAFYFALMSAGLMLIYVPLIGHWFMYSKFMSENLADLGWIYFLSLLPACIFHCLGAPFFCFYSGRGKTIPVAAINIFVCLLNILLDWLLIFGNWGFPRMGILGAGIATSASLMTGFLIILGMFLTVNQKVYPTRRTLAFSKDYFLRLVKFGTPSGLQVLSNCASFTVIILLVGQLGDMALAASSIALSINMLEFMPMIAIADSTMILVGQYIGRTMKDVSAKLPYRSWRLAIVYGVLMLLVYIFFSDPVIRMFRPAESGSAIDFKDVAYQGWLILIMMGIWNLSDSVRYVFGGAMRGAGDTRALMLINMVCAWCVGIPGFVFLVYVIRPSAGWVWSYFIVVATVEGLWTFLRFHSGAWRNIRLVRK